MTSKENRINICTLHGMATARLEWLAVSGMAHEEKRIIAECIDIMAAAAESAMAMEERLREYREAIEKLGFARTEGR